MQALYTTLIFPYEAPSTFAVFLNSQLIPNRLQLAAEVPAIVGCW
jgi:hypothetical protein